MSITDLLIRLTGPCPLWHVTHARIWRCDDGRMIAECAACGRDVVTVLADQPKGAPIAPLRAQVDRNWWRETAHHDVSSRRAADA